MNRANPCVAAEGMLELAQVGAFVGELDRLPIVGYILEGIRTAAEHAEQYVLDNTTPSYPP